ncbi:MAG: MerR family transcriptional regulator [Actinomycetales bacterium]
MRFAELCAATDVPSATVKYYLREGLLPAGERVSATRAQYGPEHVERLRLISALVDGAQLSIDGVRRIVEAIEQPPPSQHDIFGVAQQAINGPPPDVEIAEETHAALRRLGWGECEPRALAHLQAALDTAERAGFAVTGERLVAYGQALGEVARYDVDALLADPSVQTPSGALRHVAVGTVVTDPVLVALRRLAHEQESERRFRNS